MSLNKLSQGPNVVAAIVSRNALANQVHDDIDGLNASSDVRCQLSSGCLHQALEHGAAISHLIGLNCVGSAFALARPMLEAYARGIWLHRSASDIEIQSFCTKNFGPNLSELLIRMEQVPGFNVGTLLAMKEQLKTLHAFTHTGYAQVVRRLTETEVTSNYDDGEIVQLIGFESALTCLAAISLCGIADRADIASNILNRTKS